MTEYQKHSFNLSDGQKTKINNAFEKGGGTTIRISKKNLDGNDVLFITETQLNKIKKAKNGVQLNLSHAQIKQNKPKHGGFLPFLIPIIAAAVGAAGGLTGGIASAVNSSKQTSEQVRHNKEMEAQNKAAIEQMKSGTGVVSDFVEKVPLIGKKLSPLVKKYGLGSLCDKPIRIVKSIKGLYLEPSDGSKLFLGPWKE
jgi:hypothetical protein